MICTLKFLPKRWQIYIRRFITPCVHNSSAHKISHQPYVHSGSAHKSSDYVIYTAALHIRLKISLRYTAAVHIRFQICLIYTAALYIAFAITKMEKKLKLISGICFPFTVCWAPNGRIRHCLLAPVQSHMKEG